MTRVNSYIFKLLKLGFGPILTRDIFAALVRFFVTVAAARQLNSADFSSYVIIIMIASYSDVVFRFKTDQSVGYFVGKKIYSEENIIKIQNTLILLSSIILCVTLWSTKNIIFKYISNENINLSYIILYIISYCLLMQFYTAHVYLHLFKEDFRRYKHMTIISSGVLLILTALAMLIYIDLYVLLFSQNIGILLAVIYTAKHSNYMSHFKLSLNVQDLRTMISYSGKLYLLNLIGVLQTNYVVTMASFLLSASDVGHVGLLRQFFQIAERIPSFFNQIFFGTMMRDQEDKKKMSIKIGIINFLLVTFIIAIIGFFLHPINKILLDNKFPNILQYYIYLAPAICFFSVTASMILFLNSQGNISTSIYNYTISLGSSILCCLPFINQFSIEILGAMSGVFSFSFMALTIRSIIKVEN